MEDFLWGLWNGITAWPILIAHVFGAWERFPVYNCCVMVAGISSAS